MSYVKNSGKDEEMRAFTSIPVATRGHEAIRRRGFANGVAEVSLRQFMSFWPESLCIIRMPYLNGFRGNQVVRPLKQRELTEFCSEQ